MQRNLSCRVVLVGLGGIGSRLARPLFDLLASDPDRRWHVVLVDGDSYEEGNIGRQDIPKLGYKAYVWAQLIWSRYAGKMTVESLVRYVADTDGPDTCAADLLVRDGDIILGCVDNHRTRLVLSEAAKQLSNVVYISGGNGESTTGTVLVHIRQGGVDLLPPIETYHPEIAQPDDQAPYEQNCMVQIARGNIQRLVTNLRVATAMLEALQGVLDGTWNAEEIVVDTAFAPFGDPTGVCGPATRSIRRVNLG